MRREKIIREINELLGDDSLTDGDLIRELTEVIEYCNNIIASKPGALADKP